MRKFPVIHQYDSMQCGIACLQMVCKYFGRDYSLESLSKLCFATTEGVSMLGINEQLTLLDCKPHVQELQLEYYVKLPYLVLFIGTKITLWFYIR